MYSWEQGNLPDSLCQGTKYMLVKDNLEAKIWSISEDTGTQNRSELE